MYRLLLTLLLAAALSACAATAPSRDGEASADKLRLAEKAYQQGLFVEAESYYRELVSDNPELYEGWFRLGNIYARTGQLDAAITMYERCLDLDPDQARAWYNLALVRTRQSLRTLADAEQRFADRPADQRRLGALRQRLVEALTSKDGEAQ
ncbi:tetratricopeptide repeat protein [Alloalcanivorax sp. C16-2]|uniref:tetratricopeptide repeat protein n=1 Tax=Alloalcanivorax TaxID=3020832 RepID=UPI001933D019|nr:tetratricopeptide repeat protein [Alloalcanivorax marinus]MBL7250931.1 tetratricopeptide repeat protein [Alloalcanivorax marinus]